MTNRQLVKFYQWLRQLARKRDAARGPDADDRLRRAAAEKLGREASRRIGGVDPDTGGLDRTRAWAVRYLSDVMKRAPGEDVPFDSDTSFVGYHEEIVRIRSSIADLAASPHPVLLIGERGTGSPEP